MLTALEEGEKKKSVRYWPDQEDKVLNLPNAGIEIQYEMTNYTGVYLERKLVNYLYINLKKIILKFAEFLNWSLLMERPGW